jgi:uncharacterized protein YlxW (UPF0749 family)
VNPSIYAPELTILDRRHTKASQLDARHSRRAAFWHGIYVLVGWPVAALSALVSTAIFAAENLQLLAGVMAAVVTGLTATDAFFKPSERAVNNRRIAYQYEKLARTIERVTSSIEEYTREEAISRLQSIDEEFDRIQHELAQQQVAGNATSSAG